MILRKFQKKNNKQTTTTTTTTTTQLQSDKRRVALLSQAPPQLKLLTQHQFFKEWDSESVSVLVKRAEPLLMEPGEFISRQGSLGDRLLIQMSGTVVLIRQGGYPGSGTGPFVDYINNTSGHQLHYRDLTVDADEYSDAGKRRRNLAVCSRLDYQNNNNCGGLQQVLSMYAIRSLSVNGIHTDDTFESLSPSSRILSHCVKGICCLSPSTSEMMLHSLPALIGLPHEETSLVIEPSSFWCIPLNGLPPLDYCRISSEAFLLEKRSLHLKRMFSKTPIPKTWYLSWSLFSHLSIDEIHDIKESDLFTKLEGKVRVHYFATGNVAVQKPTFVGYASSGVLSIYDSNNMVHSSRVNSLFELDIISEESLSNTYTIMADTPVCLWYIPLTDVIEVVTKSNFSNIIRSQLLPSWTSHIETCNLPGDVPKDVEPSSEVIIENSFKSQNSVCSTVKQQPQFDCSGCLATPLYSEHPLVKFIENSCEIESIRYKLRVPAGTSEGRKNLSNKLRSTLRVCYCILSCLCVTKIHLKLC